MTRKKMHKVYEDSERTVWAREPDDKPPDLSKEVERLEADIKVLRDLNDSLLKELAEQQERAYTIVLARLATSPSMSVRLRIHYWKKLVTYIWGDGTPEKAAEQA